MPLNFKNILVPFDNSKSAFKALELAILFGKKCNSKVTMVHVVTSPSRDQSDQVKSVMAKKKEESGLEFLFLKQTGRIHIGVIEAAKTIEADLIVMGTHGASGFQEFWIGTNAFRVVSSALVPVITVREDVESIDFKNIIIPIDDFKETRQKVPTAIGMAKLLGAQVHVFETSKYTMEEVSNKLDRYGQQIAKLIEEEEVGVVSAEKFGGNITENVLNYADEVRSAIIIMMSETESSTGLFLGSNAQQLVNHSRVPVMTLHGKNLTSIVLGY
ncbi:MAG: nucleotide-binding universal stress UspA family protein [Patiriisocius sp.]|jgi:nucleotide-binding universal stress UspA family protein